MGEWKWCPTCGKYDSFGFNTHWDHKCKPRWECILEGLGDEDWHATYASDAEQAAELYAEYYDSHSGEYSIVSGRGYSNDNIVLVRKNSDGPIERFAIEAESVPTYRGAKLS